LLLRRRLLSHFSLLHLRSMMPHGTAHSGAGDGMMTREVTRYAADCGALDAAVGTGSDRQSSSGHG
jgi:hypothetical protein